MILFIFSFIAPLRFSRIPSRSPTDVWCCQFQGLSVPGDYVIGDLDGFRAHISGIPNSNVYRSQAGVVGGRETVRNWWHPLKVSGTHPILPSRKKCSTLPNCLTLQETPEMPGFFCFCFKRRSVDFKIFGFHFKLAIPCRSNKTHHRDTSWERLLWRKFVPDPLMLPWDSSSPHHGAGMFCLT